MRESIIYLSVQELRLDGRRKGSADKARAADCICLQNPGNNRPRLLTHN